MIQQRLKQFWALPLVAIGFGSVALYGASTAGANGEGETRVIRAEGSPTQADRAEYGTDKSKKAPGAPLRPGESDKATGHVRNDPWLKPILANPHSIVREGPWSRHSGELIGVVREYAFAEPVNVSDRRWPGFTYDEAKDDYYQTGSNMSVAGMREITVFIDNRKGVVAAQPNAEATVVAGTNASENRQEKH